MVAIMLQRAAVDFPIYGAATRSITKNLLRMGSGARVSHGPHKRITVHALNDVSLHVNEGERVGLIGANGAGKSTLLRTVAGIYEPTRGHAQVQGHVTTLFSLNIGIQQEATGFENIILRGLAAGMTRRGIEDRVGDIADFTELGDHLDLPIYTYSAGMRARLAFAISTAVEPEILLMDEWIGVGDAKFIQKARRRLRAVVDNARILMLASHNKTLLKKVCNRIIELEAGRIQRSGDPQAILEI